MAADGSIGVSEVARFSGLVQGAEGVGNVLGQLGAGGGVDGIGAGEGFHGAEVLQAICSNRERLCQNSLNLLSDCFETKPDLGESMSCGQNLENHSKGERNLYRRTGAKVGYKRNRGLEGIGTSWVLYGSKTDGSGPVALD